MSDQEIRYRKAKARVRDLKGFYVHLTVYVLVNLVLLTINLLTSPHRLWFVWPLMGWGIGLVLHALRVFGWGRRSGEDWEERKTNELMERGENR
jgi:hypothetical protein